MQLASLRDFINSGNNIYYTIALIVILLLFVIAMISLSISRRKNKKKSLAEKGASDELLSEIKSKPNSPLGVSEESEIKDSLDWESDQAVFVLPDELMEGASGYEESEKNEDDLFNRVTGYSLSENQEDKKEDGKAPIREYEPKGESDLTSIIMIPIKAKEKHAREKNRNVEPERKESVFEKDFIYDPDTATRPGTIQIYTDNAAKFRFRLKASNGRTVAHSQGYTQKINAKNGIEAVISAARTADISDRTIKDSIPIIGRPVFEIYLDNDGKYRFKLIAANGKNILASQGYFEKKNCLNGIQSLRDIVALHEIKDVSNIVEKEIPPLEIEPISIGIYNKKG
ncbi:MAG: tryptophanyl-tRNA synthetase [Firmicutes bacterium ADurb.Bin080]|jgi:uncharacterized protein|nr:YegP family protein [Clostridiales bacterium]OQC14513.1 MAG: tryptophanyl-tRNA synthetase [Firmicutes bacterium ADurb.Bin080]